MAPVITGTNTLSFKGSGRTSIVAAIAAPAKARGGETKNMPAKNAKKNPANVPSQVFPLLNGKFDETRPPKSEAALSSKQKMATAAKLAGAGNASNVNNMPKAK